MNGLAKLQHDEVHRLGSDPVTFCQALEETLLSYLTRLHALRDPTRYDRSRKAVMAMHSIWTDMRLGRSQTLRERALAEAIDECIQEVALENLTDDMHKPREAA